ncbi:MAG: N-carbamoylputrescine amidase, partial [Gammaproteobacteria bacterium]|nr:N-carbamoylputrescine amidase [Gammaproteobacteria bacterium]
MSMLRVAATQMACSWDLPANLDRAEKLIREAAAGGAQVILIQELFETPYFCIEQDTKHFNLATTLEQNQSLKRFQVLASELEVVLPFSWFERANRAFYNSLAMVDADGEILGVYRKSHIPNGPGYQEKNYFNPGDTGFKVWDTRYGKIGAGVCWDQWFPEAARSMALMGAELLLYPTAIGSEPPPAITLDSSGHWQRTMQGHAAANMVPVIASNRIGTEHATQDSAYELTFYGYSFIADHTGGIVAQADDHSESVLVHEFDMEMIRSYR